MDGALDADILLRVLGPLEIHGLHGNPIGIPQRKPRVLLSLLLLGAGTWVNTDRISAALWEEEPPRSSSGNIKTYVSQLRHILPSTGVMSGRIESRPGAYRINVLPGELDVWVFEEMVHEGLEALRGGNYDRAVRHSEQALELWRGQPFDELPRSTALAQATRLEEQRWSVREGLIDALLARGQHEEVLPTLRALTIEHPLRERLWGQLLLALDRSGRRAEALSAYQTLYRRLADEVGIEPGNGLRRIHQQILAADLALDHPCPDRGR